MKKYEQAKRLYKTMLSEYCEHSDSKMYLSAITADFDRLFELCWKTLKEYLDKEKGMREAKSGSPKDIIKLAYHQEMISDEEFWLKLLADRNDDSHHYNESAARAYVSRIEREYLKGVGEFLDILSIYIPTEKDATIDIPDDFLKACDMSGMYYDEFVAKIMKENDLKSDLELFQKW